METLRTTLLVTLILLLIIILYRRLLKKAGDKNKTGSYTNILEIDADREQVEIKISVPSAQDVSLQIFDSADQLLETVKDGRMESGEHTLKWKKPAQNAGKFYCLLVTSNQRATRYFS